jgi:hypothetical protein
MNEKESAEERFGNLLIDLAFDTAPRQVQDEVSRITTQIKAALESAPTQAVSDLALLRALRDWKQSRTPLPRRAEADSLEDILVAMLGVAKRMVR